MNEPKAASSATPWGPIESRFALGAFAVVTGLILAFLLGDARAFVSSRQDQLLGHAGASIGFTVAATGTITVLLKRRPETIMIMLAGAATTVTFELAQGFVPTRTVELQDAIAGFGGVLLATIGIELIFWLASMLVSLRVHVALAVIASAVLAILLATEVAPQTLATASPNGRSCPLTTLSGAGERIEIGENPTIVDSCFITGVGGLTLFGSDDITTLGSRSFLLSSPLGDLVAAVVESESLTIRTQFTTGELRDDFIQTSILMTLRSTNAGELIAIRTRDQRAEVMGPILSASYRAASYVEVLEPNTSYLLEAQLNRTTLRTSINGDEVAVTALDPDWIDLLRNSGAAQDMQLLVGNNPNRGQGFNGVIEWIEVES